MLIQQAPDRQLLNLACRYQVIESITDKVFVECVAPSSGPNILIFSRLSDRWSFINTGDFHSITEEDSVQQLLMLRGELVAKFQSLIAEGQPRDDYVNFLNWR